MADLSDVRDTLVQLIAAVLYPNGTSSPSVADCNVRVFAGWPLPAQVQEDLKNNTATVSVYPRTEEHKTTRYMDEWEQSGCNPTLITLGVAEQVITVGGQVPPVNNPHHVMLMVSGKPYPYLIQVTDTLASIAAALASLVAGDYPGRASSFGAVITLDPTLNFTAARVGNTQTVRNEVRRQNKLFQITIWANGDRMRTAIAKPIDVFLASTRRFALPDDTWARLVYMSTHDTDAGQKEQLYRRDFQYWVEYATLEDLVAPQITQFQTNLELSAGGTVQPIATAFS